MGQHLASQSSSQGQVQQRSRESSLESAQIRGNAEDETYESEQEFGKIIAKPSLREIAEGNVTRLLKGKEKDWAAVAQKKGPLRLLELPLDILKMILKEVITIARLNLEISADRTHRLHTPTIWRIAQE